MNERGRASKDRRGDGGDEDALLAAAFRPLKSVSPSPEASARIRERARAALRSGRSPEAKRLARVHPRRLRFHPLALSAALAAAALAIVLMKMTNRETSKTGAIGGNPLPVESVESTGRYESGTYLPGVGLVAFTRIETYTH